MELVEPEVADIIFFEPCLGALHSKFATFQAHHIAGRAGHSGPDEFEVHGTAFQTLKETQDIGQGGAKEGLTVNGEDLIIGQESSRLGRGTRENAGDHQNASLGVELELDADSGDLARQGLTDPLCLR